MQHFASLNVQQIGAFVTLGDPYAVLGLEAVALCLYCDRVEWSPWNLSLPQQPTGFLQCLDTVGWVIWFVEIVPEMTYKVSSGTFSVYTLKLALSLWYKRVAFSFDINCPFIRCVHQNSSSVLSHFLK